MDPRLAQSLNHNIHPNLNHATTPPHNVDEFLQKYHIRDPRKLKYAGRRQHSE